MGIFNRKQLSPAEIASRDTPRYRGAALIAAGLIVGASAAGTEITNLPDLSAELCRSVATYDTLDPRYDLGTCDSIESSLHAAAAAGGVTVPFALIAGAGVLAFGRRPEDQ